MSNVHIKDHLKGKINVGKIKVDNTKDFTEFDEYKECLDTSERILNSDNILSEDNDKNKEEYENE